MRRAITIAGAVIGLIVFGVVMAIGYNIGHGPAVAGNASPVRLAAAAPTVTPHFFVTIATEDMLGTQVGPAFVPGSFTLPANSDVTVTFVNFDDATDLGANAKYATPTGIKGELSVETLDATNPNAAGTVTKAASLDPKAGVSHTFTIQKLGINVPIAPKAKTTVTFHTGAAGTYDWHCFDPCGTGDTGWGGAMSDNGYMGGKITLA